MSNSPRARTRFDDDCSWTRLQPLTVAAAVVGSAVVGAVGSSIASSNAADASNNATEAASRSAADGTQLSREQLDFTKQQYADSKPYRDQAAQRALEISDAQLKAQNQSTAIAADYDAYNKGTYRPLEQKIVGDASAYDTPERRAAAAEGAVADVGQSFAAAKDATARRLSASGVNAGSARSVAALGGQAIEQAKASAGAAYTARKGVETVGAARMADAANLGRNLPSAQATAAGLGITAGNSSAGNATAALNATNAGVQGMQAGYNGAANAALGAGNLYNATARTGMAASAQSNALWGQTGSVVGAGLQQYMNQPAPPAAGGWGAGSSFAGSSYNPYTANDELYLSDEKLKREIAPVDDDDALEAINATPVKSWQYDPAALAAEGIDPATQPEGTQVGPMAQDVQRTMGEQAAPGGKQISSATLNGVALRGVQAVDKKVERLAKQVTSLSQMIRSGKLQPGAAA